MLEGMLCWLLIHKLRPTTSTFAQRLKLAHPIVDLVSDELFTTNYTPSYNQDKE